MSSRAGSPKPRTACRSAFWAYDPELDALHFEIHPPEVPGAVAAPARPAAWMGCGRDDLVDVLHDLYQVASASVRDAALADLEEDEASPAEASVDRRPSEPVPPGSMNSSASRTAKPDDDRLSPPAPAPDRSAPAAGAPNGSAASICSWSAACRCWRSWSAGRTCGPCRASPTRRWKCCTVWRSCETACARSPTTTPITARSTTTW